MKTIFGICALSIVSLSLLVWILVLGFQAPTPVDVFGGTFDHLESANDIILTFVVPLVLVLGFAVLIFNLFKIFD